MAPAETDRQGARHRLGAPGWRGNLSRPATGVEQGDGTILRSKVDCLRVCEQGPIAVVYPDGVWYHSVAGEVLDRIIQEHLVEGRTVDEYVFAVDDLSAPSRA